MVSNEYRDPHRTLGSRSTGAHRGRNRHLGADVSRRYLAVPVLLLIGAYLRIVFALCAAVAWVRRKFKASRARMTEAQREELWW
jgi:hypothetical protein